MKLFKNILRLLFSILLVFLFIGTWFPMKYIYDNLSYSYLFPFLSFHLYTGLLYILILFAFFYSSPKGLLSKVIGLILSGLLAYKEYTFYFVKCNILFVISNIFDHS